MKAYVYISRHIALIPAVTALLGLMGCGYHFKGAGLYAPEGVGTIAIMVLENKTSESGIETVFTGDLIYEFTRSKVIRLADKDKADAVLSGGIVSIDTETISHTATYDSAVRRVKVIVSLGLKRRDGMVIWSTERLSDTEPFDVAESKVTTESNKRAAIETVSERLAEKVHNRILAGF